MFAVELKGLGPYIQHMQVESKFAKKAVYIVGGEGLREVWDFMEGKFGERRPVTAELNCSDEVTRRCDNWEELSGYRNVASRRIKSLTLDAGKSFAGQAMTISWDERSTLGRSVAVSIWCEEAEILAMRTSVEDILDGMRHGLLSRLAGTWQWLCIALLVAGLTWMITIGATSETRWPVIWQSLWVCGVAVGILTVYMLALLGRELGNRFLPRVHFTLGQGAKRYENWMKSWKMTGGALLLALTLLGTLMGFLL